MKRWLGIRQCLTVDERLAEQLADANFVARESQKAHISDLRVLIDKGHEREERLARMIEVVVENRFASGLKTGNPSENRSTPVIPVENLSDVATFDEGEDAGLMREQEKREEELNNELSQLVGEQNQQGIHEIA